MVLQADRTHPDVTKIIRCLRLAHRPSTTTSSTRLRARFRASWSGPSTATARGGTRWAGSPTPTSSTVTRCSRSSPLKAGACATAIASSARPTTWPSRAADKPQLRALRAAASSGGPARKRFSVAEEHAVTSACKYHAGEPARPWTRAATHGSSIRTRSRNDRRIPLRRRAERGILVFGSSQLSDPTTGELFNFGIQYGPRPRLRTYRVDNRTAGSTISRRSRSRTRRS